MANILKEGMKISNLRELCNFADIKYDEKFNASFRNKMRDVFDYSSIEGEEIVVTKVKHTVKKNMDYDKYKYNIGDVLNVKTGRIEILKKSHIQTKTSKRRSYIVRCLECGHEYENFEYNLDNRIGCGCCANLVIVPGINDIHTTNKELANLLLNYEDGFKYSEYSGKKIDFKCPLCGTIHRNKIINNIRRRGLPCPCNKTASYPNRFMFWTLTSLGIEFNNEITFPWSEDKRYDFYIKVISTIIEMHGSQHYIENWSFTGRSLQWQIDNDNYKEKLALDNGIKNYLQIDARRSEFNFVKNNVINSELASLLDLSKVDWDFVNEKCEANIIYEIANYWNSGIHTAKKIGKIVGLSKSPVVHFLHKCVDFGLIEEYGKDVTENERRKNAKLQAYQTQATPMYCNELDLYFGSMTLCRTEMKRITGFTFSTGNIRGTTNGKYSHHHHFTFKYITREEFNRIKTESPDKAYGDFFNTQKSA